MMQVTASLVRHIILQYQCRSVQDCMKSLVALPLLEVLQSAPSYFDPTSMQLVVRKTDNKGHKATSQLYPLLSSLYTYRAPAQ